MIFKKALILFGPTSSGKSNISLKISANINSKIINADSMQVYKNLRVLTSRPSEEDEKKFDHKLYGIIDGDKSFSVASWLDLTKREIKASWSQNKLPILVGGTGMYIKSLIDGISEIPSIPDSIKLETEEVLKKNGLKYMHDKLIKSNKNSKIYKNDTQRIIRAFNVLQFTGRSIEEWQKENKKVLKDINFEIYIPHLEREILYKNSDKRFDLMLKQGAIDEVKTLVEQNIDPKYPIMKAIGVREIQQYLSNRLSLEECVNLSKKNTRNYIKRQLTWIRGNNISSNIDIKKYI